MGCNKSFPNEIIRSIPEPEFAELNIPARQKTNRVVAKEVGAINKHFKILKAIGTSSLGTLLYAQDLQSGTFRAVREMDKNLAKHSMRLFEELQALMSIDYPNIVKIYETIETPIHYYIAFEYLDGGTLRSQIKRIGNEMLVSKYIHDIISAIKYMHLIGFVHCDLSPDHILFDSNEQEPVPKIIHFSNSQKINDVQHLELENLSCVYMSPEIIDKSFNEKTDMWSIGIIVYEMLVGKHPYSSKEKVSIMKEIYQGHLDFESQNFTNLSFSAQDFIKKLLQINPEERLSAKDALLHPWLGLTTKECYVTSEALMRLRSFKLKSNITREIIKEINSKINFKEHDIISLFKQLDSDCDGTISKDEIVKAFSQVSIDASQEIDTIMTNLDIDLSGSLDFTELKIALVEWEKEITKKNLAKVFKSEQGNISLDLLKHKYNVILPHEWNEFSKNAKVEEDQVSLKSLKDYLKSHIG